VVGHEEFRRALAADAPRSAEGHALKDLHLEGRLFRFRCSYLSYSAAFRGLPDTLKVRVLDRLRTELQSKDPNGRYAYIPEEERQQIFSLLRQTHADARECWKEPASIAGQTVARR
jgi:hypothetical protein